MQYAPRDKYLAGRTLTEEIHRFAFPRTGSHFLTYSLNGLFDLVTFPHAHLHNAEAIARQTEINPEVRYALDLREEGAGYHPLFVNTVAGGTHGLPFASDKRRMILIRHPLPTLYSLFRVNRDRWGAVIDEPAAWLQGQLAGYLDFYHAAFDVLAGDPERTLLVRYEALTSGPEALEEVVRFVGRGAQNAARGGGAWSRAPWRWGPRRRSATPTTTCGRAVAVPTSARSRPMPGPQSHRPTSTSTPRLPPASRPSDPPGRAEPGLRPRSAQMSLDVGERAGQLGAECARGRDDRDRDQAADQAVLDRGRARGVPNKTKYKSHFESIFPIGRESRSRLELHS